jgi:hypothetical protein
MSVWSAKRQLLYLSAVVAIGLIFVAVMIVRNIDTTPTCFDGKQNGEEESVDCGGACQLVCTESARNVIVRWVRPFQVTDDVYHVAAFIENQNIEAGVRSVRYRFRLYDDNNIIIGERIGETFIGPNQRSVIFEPSVTTGNRVPTRAFFEFLEPAVWVTTSLQWSTANLLIKNRLLENEDTTPRLIAELENITLGSIFDIEVVALLFDEHDNAITASRTIVPQLGPNSTQQLFFTWPEPLIRPAVRVEVIPRVNVFSSDNRT